MSANYPVVQSAVSSFNNAALLSPDFFWSALLALPIFFVFWVLAPTIAARFLPDSKSRTNIMATLVIAVTAIWTLTHASFGALRDFSWAGILVAVILCAAAVFFARRYYESGARISQYIKTSEKWKRRTDWSVPTAVVIIAALFGEHTWAGAILQGGAVAIGWTAGYLLYRKNAAAIAPAILSGAMMLLVTLGLSMQPEFFRFGQLGQLTGLHLLFLAATVAALAGHLALNLWISRPRGFLRKATYGRAKWFLIAVAALVFLLFAITESALVFSAFAILAAIFSIIYARHRPKKDADKLGVLRHDLWMVSVGLFGIITTMPVLVCAAIVLWRTNDQ